jgi:hypothetical protein
LQVLPKFTQIRIFGLKVCHLAALVATAHQNVFDLQVLVPTLIPGSTGSLEKKSGMTLNFREGLLKETPCPVST